MTMENSIYINDVKVGGKHCFFDVRTNWMLLIWSWVFMRYKYNVFILNYSSY